MPKRPASPAQIASRFTYFLKGDIKRYQKLFLLIATKLARVRDQKLWETLRHPSIEDYAQKRLGLQRSTLYHYLQIHDWVKRDHPAWLGAKPKGFIPSLSDSSALMWIESYLREHDPAKALRKELESMRTQALGGALTAAEFRALRARMRPTVAPLKAILARAKSLRRDAARVPRFPAGALAALDETIHALEQTLGSRQEIAKLLLPNAVVLARREIESAIV